MDDMNNIDTIAIFLSSLTTVDMDGRRNEANVLTCLVGKTNPGRAVDRNDAQSPDDFRGVPSSDCRRLES